MAFFFLLLILVACCAISFYASYVKCTQSPVNFWVKVIASIIIILVSIPYL